MVCFAITTIQAQDINDALRYSQTNLSGTARFTAMSGAFGALGGDFSAINVNPAGSVIFANNQVGVSFTNYHTSNDSDYFGTKNNTKNNNLTINQAGGVFVFNNDDKNSDFKKFAISLNYENTRNLDNKLYFSGTNPTNSIDSYFLSYANGIPLGNITNYNFADLYYNEQQAYLGYNAYIIDPNTNSNTETAYFTNVSNLNNYYQQNSIRSTGYNGKLNFNFSTQFKDKLSFGINLNSHFVDYRQSSSFFESNTNPKYATGTTVDKIRFNNDLYTYGNGFSFQLGTIFKPVKEVRFGLAYESPTWYRLNDELSQNVSTSGYGLNATQDNTIAGSQTVNPNITTIFEPYKLQTSGKYTASFAYIFGKKGLISIDYALKDYSNTQYKPNKDFTNTNKYMSDVLTTSSEVRLGAEYKIKLLSLRGGYRYEQSPYRNTQTMGDLTGFSGGLGYNFGSTKLDLSYAYAKRDYKQQLFTQGLVDTSKIKSTNNNITLTLLFEL